MTDLTTAIEEEDDAEEGGESATSEVKPRKSMRKAINEYCKSCTYDPEFKGGGTWREQTGACTVTKCPLWEFRPVSRPRKVSSQELNVEVGDE